MYSTNIFINIDFIDYLRHELLINLECPKLTDINVKLKADSDNKQLKGAYMTDNIKTRALDEKFLNEFLKDGKLNNILKIIQNDNSLIMCLRGNYTTVYYRGLQILKIMPDSFDVDTGYEIEKPDLKYDKEYWLQYFKEAKQKIDIRFLVVTYINSTLNYFKESPESFNVKFDNQALKILETIVKEWNI